MNRVRELEEQQQRLQAIITQFDNSEIDDVDALVRIAEELRQPRTRLDGITNYFEELEQEKTWLANADKFVEQYLLSLEGDYCSTDQMLDELLQALKAERATIKRVREAVLGWRTGVFGASESMVEIDKAAGESDE